MTRCSYSGMNSRNHRSVVAHLPGSDSGGIKWPALAHRQASQTRRAGSESVQEQFDALWSQSLDISRVLATASDSVRNVRSRSGSDRSRRFTPGRSVVGRADAVVIRPSAARKRRSTLKPRLLTLANEPDSNSGLARCHPLVDGADLGRSIKAITGFSTVHTMLRDVRNIRITQRLKK
jgi:hypothetical protein